jgi:cysteine-S-conjugate beta-lyase
LPGFLLTSEQLRLRRTAKWSTNPPDVLPAWVAEMDFATDPTVSAALAEAVRLESFGYPVRDDLLPAVTARWLEHRFDWRVAPERIQVLPDVLSGVEVAVRYFTPEGSAVILPTPAYMPFFDIPVVTRRPVIEIATLDLEALDAAFASGAGCLILCHPCNPLGHSYTLEELTALAEVVESHRRFVVSDEIHAPLTYPGRSHVPYASVSPAAAAHSITLMSASKAWNLAGLKCAQAVVGDIERWEEIPALAVHGPSSLGVAATVAAYSEGEPWLDETVSYLDDNRRELASLLEVHLPGTIYKVPDATYLAWIDCRPLGLETEPSEFFLNEAKVATSPGPAFGGDGPGHIRFNFASSRDLMGEMIERMGASLARGHK